MEEIILPLPLFNWVAGTLELKFFSKEGCISRKEPFLCYLEPSSW